MKKRNLLSGFALALLMTLGITGAAKAQLGPYTCNEGGNPPPSSGAPDGYSVNRGDSPPGSAYDTCTLGSLTTPHGFTAHGFSTYHLANIDGGDGAIIIGIGDGAVVTAGNLTAGTTIGVDGAQSLGTVTAGTSGSGSIQLYGNIAGLSAGAISNTNGFVYVSLLGTATTPSITNTNGDVRVFGHGSPLTIGSGGIGFIHNNGDFGYGIYVSDPAGINYNGADLLQVHAGSGNTGTIILDTASPDGTNTGTVTLAGTINADGSSGPGGVIDIFAAQIVANDATLSASAPGAQVGTINLVTNSITDNSGLTINLNGNNDSPGIDLSIFPIGSYSVLSAGDITSPVAFSDFANSTNPLAITGSGTFTVTANGNNNGLKIIGYPLTLNPATTTITQQGIGDGLYLASTDGGALYNTLTLGGTVAIHENTTGPGATNPIDVRGTDIAALTGHVLLDTSGTAGGDGGDIGLTVFNSGTMSIGGTGNNLELNANGSDSGGNAGNIVAGYGGTLELDVDDGAAISASALGGDGDGGHVTVQAHTLVSIATTAVSINAVGHGSGSGGQIQLLQDTAGDVDLTKFSIRATGGGDNGDGGSVTVQNVAPFDVVHLIVVNANDGGAVAAVKKLQNRSVTGFGGSIRIIDTWSSEKGDVTCQKYSNGATTYPNQFWDCTGNASPSHIQADAVASLGDAPLSILTSLDTDTTDPTVQLFTFSTANNGDVFFGLTKLDETPLPGSQGHTTAIGAHIYSMIFETTFNLDSNSHKETEASLHEAAHALDEIFRIATGTYESTQSTYIHALENDMLLLDYSSVGATEAGSTYRDPCSGLGAPLVGVVDNSTHAQFCTSGVLNDPSGQYAGNTISKILSIANGYPFSSTREVYAQAFAFDTYAYQNVGTPGDLLQQSFDGLMAERIGYPYLTCLYGWADALANGGGRPPTSPSYCTDNVPSWYLPYSAKQH